MHRACLAWWSCDSGNRRPSFPSSHTALPLLPHWFLAPSFGAPCRRERSDRHGLALRWRGYCFGSFQRLHGGARSYASEPVAIHGTAASTAAAWPQLVSGVSCRALVGSVVLAIRILAGKTRPFHRLLALSGKANASMFTWVAAELGGTP